MRDLTVAVELVAEDVVYHQTFHRQKFAGFAEGGLVALDQRVRIRALARGGAMLREHGDDTGQQVCARFVGEVFQPRVGKGLLDHARGGGFAVGAGHDRDLDAARQLAEDILVDFKRQLAGQVGAAASQFAQHRARGLAHRNGQPGFQFHRITPLSCQIPV